MSNQEEKKAKSLRAFKDWIRIRARAEKKTPLEVTREIQFELNQMKQKQESLKDNL